MVSSLRCFSQTCVSQTSASHTSARLTGVRDADVEPTRVYPNYPVTHAIHALIGIVGSVLSVYTPVAGAARRGYAPGPSDRVRGRTHPATRSPSLNSDVIDASRTMPAKSDPRASPSAGKSSWSDVEDAFTTVVTAIVFAVLGWAVTRARRQQPHSPAGDRRLLRVALRHLLTNTSGYGMVLTECPLQRAMADSETEAGVDPVRFGADEWLARLAEVLSARLENHLDPELESAAVWLGGGRSYRGLEGFRRMWLDWLEPWESYRSEIAAYKGELNSLRRRANFANVDVAVEGTGTKKETYIDPVSGDRRP